MRTIAVALFASLCTACHNAQYCRDGVDCRDGENVHHVRIPPQKIIVERGGGADCPASRKEGEVVAQGVPEDKAKDGKVGAQGEPTPSRAAAAGNPAPSNVSAAAAPIATYAPAAAPMQMQMQAAPQMAAQAFAPAGLIPIPTIPGRPAIQFGFKVIRIPIPIPTLSLTETPPETSVAFVQAQQPQFAAVQSAGFVAQPQMAVQTAGFAAAPMGVQAVGYAAPQQVVAAPQQVFAAPQQVVAAPQQVVQASVAAPQAAVVAAGADDGMAELIKLLLEAKRKKAAASSAAAASSSGEQEIKRLEEWTTRLENMVDALQKKLEEKNRKAGEAKPKGQSDANGTMWQPAAAEPSKKSVSWERAPYQSTARERQTAAAN